MSLSASTPFSVASGLPVPPDPIVLADRAETEPPTSEALVPITDPVSLDREQRKMQDLFSALAFALRSFKNLNQVLELIGFVASHLTEAEGGALVIFHRNGTIALEQLHCADPERREQIRASLEKTTQTLSQTSLSLTGSNRRLPNPGSFASSELSTEYTTWVEQLLDEQFRHDLGSEVQLFGTPLLIRNTVRGRLYVFSRSPRYDWSENRQQWLRVIADQAAVAIENDELTAELRRKAALDKELEIGSEIQAQLLPRQCPVVPGIALAARCQNAKKVGGDYYDFIKVPGGDAPDRWGIVIGDVMGKGVPAGLLMTMTRGMLRAEVLNRHNPARILQHLNQVMFSDLETSNRFVSLFYSEYDPHTHILRYSNAAHNPTYWWQAKSQQILQLDTLGSLIGLDCCSSYEEGSVQLQAGDVVVYYTDGFTDAVNANGERLDTIRLEAAIQKAATTFTDPQAILVNLFEQVEAFQQASASNGTRAARYGWTEDQPLDWLTNPQEWRDETASTDDRTLVVLKVLPTST